MAADSRLVLITGVTRGLGMALAKGMMAAGHTVMGCGRGGNHIRRLRDQHPPPNDFDVVDISRGEQVQRWAARLLAKYGAPALLINNAAIIHANAPLWRIPTAEFDQVIDINIKGTANVLRHFLPAMVERGQGVIVNLSSGWGRSTAAEVSGYCASKFAIEGLTKSLAQELPSGMAAVPLNPGVIDTDMLRLSFGTQAAAYPSPAEWARRAVPFILHLGPRDNGKSMTVPGG